MQDKKIPPFLKWPGGKRWISDELVKQFPTPKVYIEPFLGSGAIFWKLKPEKAILSDINSELIEVYNVMKDYPIELSEKLMFHQRKHSKEYYYKMRKMKPRTEINRAARFIYLNRTCFNGMYRVNEKGEFNVPIGTKNNCIYDLDMFSTYSMILKNVNIISCDFEKTIAMSEEGDLIFADPPYAMTQGDNFIKYNDHLFTWEDQKRLLTSLVDAREKGVNIVVTNASCKDIEEMYYKEGFYIWEKERICSISGKIEKRKLVKELLITSFELGEKRG